MQKLLARNAGPSDEFSRLHRLFLEHFGIALGLVWIASAFAGLRAPWVHNIRGLIDPLARPEGTFAFLFGLPLLMTAGWLCLLFGGDLIRRSQVLRSQALEFAIAGAAVFAVFCLALHRVVAAVSVAV
ncbi:hypothetical protein [uncultured Enterovirga sp.]|uniref:hypothetical protein n=1 Tax=uncultured Enterovirga sp. TaxID=2026352 RepID=UPI0035CAB4A6